MTLFSVCLFACGVWFLNRCTESIVIFVVWAVRYWRSEETLKLSQNPRGMQRKFQIRLNWYCPKSNTIDLKLKGAAVNTEAL